MKTSWIIGVMMLYISIFFYGSIMTNANTLSGEMGHIFNLAQPTGLDLSNLITAAYSVSTEVWYYMVIFIEAIFLWFPGLWTGNWFFVWLFLCVPICIGMIFGIITMLRGSSSV
jgi:hypothetical protein